MLEAKLEQPGWFPTGDAGLLSYIRERIDKPSQNYLVCMEIEITTPDSAVASWRQPIFLLTKEGQGREYYGSRLLFDPSKPLTGSRKATTCSVGRATNCFMCIEGPSPRGGAGI